MIQKPHSFRSSCFAALLCATSAVSLFAQGPEGPPPGGGGNGGPGPGGHHHGPPPSPLFDALDTNHDGAISADEMASAPAALKKLLKPGATELKPDDLRPPHPPGPPADGGQPGGDSEQPPRPRPQARRSPAPADSQPAASPGADATPSGSPTNGNGGHPPHHGPPPGPLFHALDTNHDGAISSDEMDKAEAALKALLKPGATELKREDMRPPHPPQPPPQS